MLKSGYIEVEDISEFCFALRLKLEESMSSCVAGILLKRSENTVISEGFF